MEQLLGNEPAGKAAVVRLLEELSAEAGSDSDWENKTLADYLESLAALLESIENSYINEGAPIPSDPWILIGDALKGARYYE